MGAQPRGAREESKGVLKGAQACRISLRYTRYSEIQRDTARYSEIQRGTEIQRDTSLLYLAAHDAESAVGQHATQVVRHLSTREGKARCIRAYAAHEGACAWAGR